MEFVVLAKKFKLGMLTTSNLSVDCVVSVASEPSVPSTLCSRQW
jgi:hypothetical protein